MSSPKSIHIIGPDRDQVHRGIKAKYGAELRDLNISLLSVSRDDYRLGSAMLRGYINIGTISTYEGAIFETVEKRLLSILSKVVIDGNT
jgi:hypothetical protein